MTIPYRSAYTRLMYFCYIQSSLRGFFRFVVFVVDLEDATASLVVVAVLVVVVSDGPVGFFVVVVG